MNMVDLTDVALATADYAGGGLGHATHLFLHLQAVVGGHDSLVGSRNSCPTGH